jgi:hypothetical protein
MDVRFHYRPMPDISTVFLCKRRRKLLFLSMPRLVAWSAKRSPRTHSVPSYTTMDKRQGIKPTTVISSMMHRNKNSYLVPKSTFGHPFTSVSLAISTISVKPSISRVARGTTTNTFLRMDRNSRKMEATTTIIRMQMMTIKEMMMLTTKTIKPATKMILTMMMPTSMIPT